MKNYDRRTFKAAYFYFTLTIIMIAVVNILYGQTVKEELRKEVIEQRNDESSLKTYLI